MKTNREESARGFSEESCLAGGVNAAKRHGVNTLRVRVRLRAGVQGRQSADYKKIVGCIGYW